MDAADFVEALKDGLQDNSSERQRKSLEKEISTLVTVMEKIGDVKENDRVDFDYSEKQGVRVLLNNRMIGEKIGGQDLYNAVLRIWIGEKSIDDNLKKSLLNL